MSSSPSRSDHQNSDPPHSCLETAPGDNGIQVSYTWVIPSSDIERHPSNTLFTTGHICAFESPVFGSEIPTEADTKFNLLFIPNFVNRTTGSSNIFGSSNQFHYSTTSFQSSSTTDFGQLFNFRNNNNNNNGSGGSIFLQIVSSEIDQFKVSTKVMVSNGGTTLNFAKTGICKKSLGSNKEKFGFDNQIKWGENFGLPPNSKITITFEFTYQKLYDRLKRLAEDIGELRKRPRFTDVVITTSSGKEFPCHKAILATRSPVFETMFSEEKFSENQTNRIDIPDVADDVLNVFLDYLYAGDTTHVDQYALELLSVADKYNIQCLIKLCVEAMMRNIDVASAPAILYAADLYRLNELKMDAIDFINRNPTEVMATNGWTEYIVTNPFLMQQLYGNLAQKKTP